MKTQETINKVVHLMISKFDKACLYVMEECIKTFLLSINTCTIYTKPKVICMYIYIYKYNFLD